MGVKTSQIMVRLLRCVGDIRNVDGEVIDIGKTGTTRRIYITDFDLERLKELIADPEVSNERNRKHIVELEAELERASVVASKDIPQTVVTMNSRVLLEDLDSGEEITITLTFPSDADVDQGKVSVLAPVGTAIIGYSKSSVLEWNVPGGLRRLKVKDILYQPESAGDYHL
jgi:regulator of nucleoside diphosphate kinase